MAYRTGKRGRPRAFDRDQALAKALRLFWSQGYQHTTMAQLCEAMDIRSPSLYCAFGSKADLFLEALAFYRQKYWSKAFDEFLREKDIFKATRKLFEETARILLLPDAPCGCLTVHSALTLPPNETRVLQAIELMRFDTKKIFRERLKMAVKDRQIPIDSDIPAISGALTNYFEGLALQSRGDICLAELTAIALLGTRLLPESMRLQE